MTSTDALIRELSSDLPPVKRRRASRDAAALLALSAVEFGLVVATAGLRPDMGHVIGMPFMIWKIGGLALLSSLCCALAIRSFAPPALPSRDLRTVLGIAILAIMVGLTVTPTTELGRSLIERLAPAHGLMCTGAIVALSLPLMAMLGVLMRHGAPVSPKRSAVAVGLAAATTGALIFTVRCPINDPLYIVTWYTLGVAIVSATARWLLPRRFRL